MKNMKYLLMQNGRKQTKAEKRAMQEVDDLCTKWSKINFAAFLLVLYHQHGFRNKRLDETFEKCMESYDECSMQDKSMVQMCEEETGIELQNEEGKSWRNLPYMNEDVWDGIRPSPEKMIVIRQQQKKWVKLQVNAGILIAMHRKYGFGYDRLVKMFDNMEAIIQECGADVKTITKKCQDETGINVDAKIEKRRGREKNETN